MLKGISVAICSRVDTICSFYCRSIITQKKKKILAYKWIITKKKVFSRIYEIVWNAFGLAITSLKTRFSTKEEYGLNCLIWEHINGHYRFSIHYGEINNCILHISWFTVKLSSYIVATFIFSYEHILSYGFCDIKVKYRYNRYKTVDVQADDLWISYHEQNPCLILWCHIVPSDNAGTMAYRIRKVGQIKERKVLFYFSMYSISKHRDFITCWRQMIKRLTAIYNRKMITK